MPKDVLPKLTPPKGLEHLRNLDDLLTLEQRRELREHLAEMARLRRRVETEAAWIPMH